MYSEPQEFIRTTNEFPRKIRRAKVRETQMMSPSIKRFVLEGDDLDDMKIDGVTAHAQLLIPGTEGRLELPEVKDGAIECDEATCISRLVTVREIRRVPDGTLAVIDIALYRDDTRVIADSSQAMLRGMPESVTPQRTPSAGPLARWAEKADIGAEVGLFGPNSARTLPEGCTDFFFGGDITAFPMIGRWLERIPTKAHATVAAVCVDPEDVEYLHQAVGLRRDRADIAVIPIHPGAAALGYYSLTQREARPSVYMWLAGEATSLIAVRRYLKSHPDVNPKNMQLFGYWKLGHPAFTHNDAIDPTL